MEGEGGREEDCNRESALSRLKRPVRAKIGRERSVKRLWYGVLLGKRHEIDTGWGGWRDTQMEEGVDTFRKRKKNFCKVKTYRKWV